MPLRSSRRGGGMARPCLPALPVCCSLQSGYVRVLVREWGLLACISLCGLIFVGSKHLYHNRDTPKYRNPNYAFHLQIHNRPRRNRTFSLILIQLRVRQPTPFGRKSPPICKPKIRVENYTRGGGWHPPTGTTLLNNISARRAGEKLAPQRSS